MLVYIFLFFTGEFSIVPETVPQASLVAQMVKNLPRMWEPRFDPRVWNLPWRREGLPTPIFLPGEFHGQRSLVGYSPQGRKESDVTE